MLGAVDAFERGRGVVWLVSPRHHRVEGADDLQVKRSADPHGIGVDQLAHDVGAAVATRLRGDRFNYGIFRN